MPSAVDAGSIDVVGNDERPISITRVRLTSPSVSFVIVVPPPSPAARPRRVAPVVRRPCRRTPGGRPPGPSARPARPDGCARRCPRGPAPRGGARPPGDARLRTVSGGCRPSRPLLLGQHRDQRIEVLEARRELPDRMRVHSGDDRVVEGRGPALFVALPPDRAVPEGDLGWPPLHYVLQQR